MPDACGMGQTEAFGCLKEDASLMCIKSRECWNDKSRGKEAVFSTERLTAPIRFRRRSVWQSWGLTAF